MKHKLPTTKQEVYDNIAHATQELDRIFETIQGIQLQKARLAIQLKEQRITQRKWKKYRREQVAIISTLKKQRKAKNEKSY